jgi:hypothetical protein
VITGSVCAPIAAMVATSPALPPAPDASLALKLITQAGAGGSSTVAVPLSVGSVGGFIESAAGRAKTSSGL